MERRCVASPGEHPFERAGGCELVVGEQHPHMELGPGFELHPAHPLFVEEDGWQAEAPPVLRDHLGGRAHVGEEAGTQIGELRLEGGSGDQPGVAATHQPAGFVPGDVVRLGLGVDVAEGATSEDGPHPPAEQPDDQGQDDQHDQGGERRDHELIVEIGLMGVANGPRRQPRADVPEHPGGDRRPQEQGHRDGDEQPPGVPPEPAVEHAGHHEPAEGGRVAQAVQALEPWRVVRRGRAEMAPLAAGRGRVGTAGLGVGGRPDPRDALGLRGSRGQSARIGFDPDHPGAGRGMEMEVDRSELFDAHRRHRGDRLGVCVVPGFVGAGLADHPSIVHGEEPPERAGQGRMGLHRTPGLGHRRPDAGQVEQVAGHDEDAGPVPRVEGAGQLGGDRQGRGRGHRGQQQVAHHHDPAAERDVDPCAPGLEHDGCLPAVQRGLEAHLVRRLGGGHSPTILNGTRR